MTQDINYKVNVDTADLQSQLQSAKAQIDASLAQQSFNAAMPDQSSRMFAFPSLTEASIRANGSVQGAMDVSRLGFQKFNSDMQNLALMTSVKPPSLSNDMGSIPNFNSMSPSRGAYEGATGHGYSARMGLSPGEYSLMAGRRFTDNAFETATDIGGKLSWAGMGAGALSLMNNKGWLNFGAGTATGMTAFAVTAGAIGTAAFVADTLSYDFQNANKMRGFTRDTSWRFLSKRFSANDSSSIGLEASSLQREDNVIGRRLSGSDVSSMMQEYTEVGGFDIVRTADEYRTKLKDLVANHTKVLQALHAASKETSQAMAEWDIMGLTGKSASAGNFAQTIAAQSYNAGYTPTEFLAFARQTSEMTRGTGILFGSAYVGGMSALSEVRSAQQNGMLSEDTMRHMGGPEGAAATIARTGYNFGMSKSGLTYLAAQDQLGSNANIAGMPISNVLAAAMTRLSSPQAYMEFAGSVPELLSKKDPTELYMLQASQFAREMTDYMNIPITKNTWRSHLSSYGISAPQADLMYGVMTAPTPDVGALYNRRMYEAEASMPGVLDKTLDIMGNGVAAVLGLRGIGRSLTEDMNTISVGYNAIRRGLRTYATGISRVDASAMNQGSVSFIDMANYAQPMGVKEFASHESNRLMGKEDYSGYRNKNEVVRNLTNALVDLRDEGNIETFQNLGRSQAFFESNFGMNLPTNITTVEQASASYDIAMTANRDVINHPGRYSKQQQIYARNTIATFGDSPAKYAATVMNPGATANLQRSDAYRVATADRLKTANEHLSTLIGDSINGINPSSTWNTLNGGKRGEGFGFVSAGTAESLGFLADAEKNINSNLVMWNSYQSALMADEKYTKDTGDRGAPNMASWVANIDKYSGTKGAGEAARVKLSFVANSAAAAGDISTITNTTLALNLGQNKGMREFAANVLKEAKLDTNGISFTEDGASNEAALIQVVRQNKGKAAEVESAMMKIRAQAPAAVYAANSYEAAQAFASNLNSSDLNQAVQTMNNITGLQQSIKTIREKTGMGDEASDANVRAAIAAASAMAATTYLETLASLAQGRGGAMQVFVTNL